MITCPECNSKIKQGHKFCTNCGANLRPKDSASGDQGPVSDEHPEREIKGSEISNKQTKSIEPSTNADSDSGLSLNKYVDKNWFVPIITIVGLLLVFVSLAGILQGLEFQIDPKYVLYTVIPIGLLGVIFSLVLFYIDKFNKSSQYTILLLSEIVLYTSILYYDLIFRSILSRYLLLISIPVMSLLASIIYIKSQNTELDQIHCFIFYFSAFGLLWFISGSTYIGRIYFTLTLILTLLPMHYSIIRMKEISLIFGISLLEFLVLLQSSVINSGYIQVEAIFLIISYPVFFYLLDIHWMNIATNIQLTIRGLFLLPQLALIWAVFNSGINSPWAELVLVIVYLVNIFYAREIPEEQVSDLFQYSFSILILILLGSVVYTFTSTIIYNSIILYAGTLIGILFLRYRLNNRQQNIFKGIIAVSTVIVYYGLISQFDLNYFLIVGIFVGLVGLNFGLEIITQSFTMYDIVILGLYSSMISIANSYVEFFVPHAFIISTVIISIAYMLLQQNYDVLAAHYYVILISIPQFFLINLLDNNHWYFWLVLAIDLLVILIMGIVERDQIPVLLTDWLILSLPVLLLLNNIQNNYTINSGITLLSLIGLIGVLWEVDSETEILGQLFLFTALVMRLLLDSEKGQILGMQVLPVSIGIILGLLSTILVYKVLSGHLRSEDLVYFVGYFTISAFSLLRLENQNHIQAFEYLSYGLQAFLTILLLGVILASLINTSADQIGFSDYIIIMIASYLSLLNIIISILQYYYISWVVSTLLIAVYSFYIKSDHNYLQIFWSAFLGINLILFSLVNVYLLSIAILTGIVILYLPSSIYHKSINYRELKAEFRILNNMIIFIVFFVIIYLNTQLLILNKLFGSGLWFILSSLYLYSTIRDYEIDGQVIITGIIIIFSTLLFMQLTNYLILTFFAGSLLATYTFYIERSILRQEIKIDLIPLFSFYSVGIVSIWIGEIIGIFNIIIMYGIVDIFQFSQIFLGLGLFIFLLSFILGSYYSHSNISNSGIILGNLMIIVFAIIGFGQNFGATLFLGTIAIILSIIAVKYNHFRFHVMAISTTALSVIKALFDIIFLSQLDNSISLLIVGLQIVWYSILYNNDYLELLFE